MKYYFTSYIYKLRYYSIYFLNFRFNILSVESVAEVDKAVEALHKGSDSIVRYVLDMEKCTKN